ncbi:MAG: hypothetical protein HYR60_32385 [Acidobacteria bacterium]|nr:hypothetical protein [Acidobacteriota bacterium]MBI3471461.1 hypothetical protein [Candidatus Solibacter usitatus]
MAENTVQQVALDAFRAASGNREDQLAEALGEAARRLVSLTAVNETLAEAVASNTEAVASNTAAQGGSSLAKAIGKAASGEVLGSGLLPLFSTLMRVFGGGQPEAPPPLVRYTPPPPVRLDVDRERLAPVDYGQDGRPRAIETPQITVQVQAMDSRSFLDHSHEIARAVREAMLEMHPINDVVSDL